MVRSQTRCLVPWNEWNSTGQATRNLPTIFTATGSAAADAASVADSRCHPVRGAARYARLYTYRPPVIIIPVNRVQIDAPSHICE